jgi:hypothetical protein
MVRSPDGFAELDLLDGKPIRTGSLLIESEEMRTEAAPSP